MWAGLHTQGTPPPPVRVGPGPWWPPPPPPRDSFLLSRQVNDFAVGISGDLAVMFRDLRQREVPPQGFQAWVSRFVAATRALQGALESGDLDLGQCLLEGAGCSSVPTLFTLIPPPFLACHPSDGNQRTHMFCLCAAMQLSQFFSLHLRALFSYLSRSEAL